MPSFICKVITPQGQVVKFKMSETDKISCLKKLKKNGMTPIDIKNSLSISVNSKKKNTATVYSKRKKNYKLKNTEIQFSNKISLEEIKNFTQEFYFLRKSKFTNVHALATITDNTENLSLKKILNDILENLKEGKFIYKTMEEYDSVFPFVYINLIKNGELTGSLDKSLEYAIKYLDDEEKLNNSIQKKIVPNIIIFIGILILIFLSIIIGIPIIQDIFDGNGSGIALPKITIFISEFCRLIVQKWYFIIVALLIFLGIFIKYESTEKGRYNVDYFKYKNKLFGRVIYLFDFSRLIRCLIINLENNMRIQDALEVSKNVIKNTYMLNTIEVSINNIYIGKSWIEPFENQKILNTITIEMLKNGTDNTGIDSIEKTIDYMDVQIEKEVDKLLNKLSKISYLIFGIVILIFIGVVLIPCISVYLSNFLFV
jgi:type IV pilus assembly protein PilC